MGTIVKKILALCVFVAVLAGCSSGVKLDDDSMVKDRSGSSLNGDGSGVGSSSLVGRDLAGSGSMNSRGGPAGVDSVIYFDYDSYTVKPEYQAVLEAHARFLKADRKRKASLEGNTDERGGREYNLALGQKRSDSVRKALSSLGVPDEQLEAVSFGKEKPAATGGDEAAFAKNRRVEMNYR
jgi:peptidoglycan-associated lipoprotein